jgi:hypothetical protein
MMVRLILRWSGSHLGIYFQYFIQSDTVYFSLTVLRNLFIRSVNCERNFDPTDIKFNFPADGSFSAAFGNRFLIKLFLHS